MPNTLKYTPNHKKSFSIITQSENGLEINPQVKQFLLSLPSKRCHILAIVGKTKIGKSSLINHIIRHFDKQSQKIQYFPVFDNIGGGTKGINLSSVYAELDEENILLFLDVQGLGRFNNSDHYQSKLFAMVLMLSTILMYNTVGPIDEQTLQNLSVFIEIGKLLQKPVFKRQDLNIGIQFGMPSFFMILRDFSLKLQDKQGFSVTTKQYLESALTQQKGGTNIIFHKNRIRRTIKQLFKIRQCQTLVLPSDQLPINQNSLLRNEFLNDLDRLFNKIKTHLNSEVINNKKLLTPKQLLLYIEQILNNINCNISVPKITSILTNIYQKQINNLKQQFKQKLIKISKQFQKQNIIIQNIINTVSIDGSLQQNYIQRQINKLLNYINIINQDFQKIYYNIESFIIKQKNNDCSHYQGKNQKIIDIQQLKILESIKKLKEQQFHRKISDLKEMLILQKKKAAQLKLQNQQTAQFQKIVQQLISTQDDKQLEKKYRSFIFDLKQHCNKVNSKEFETGILKCEIAFLKRKLQLKERIKINDCNSCKFGNLQNQNLLKQRTNINPEDIINKQKYQGIKKIQKQQFQPSKSFYVPYIILSDPTIMSVQIIKTLIKQDYRLNSYIQYVLQVVILQRRWTFNRKWKDFNELHSIITSLFTNTPIPLFADAQIGLKNNFQVQKQEVQKRRQSLEQYLRELLEIEPIRNSRIMQKFLKINKEYVTTL